MKCFVITCPELPERGDVCRAHLKERGVEADYLPAIHAETFGILAWRPYRLNKPQAGECVAMAHVGCSLSHYMTWIACSVLPDPFFMILEDDVRFVPDWKERLDQALTEAGEFDILLVGSANTLDKRRTQVCGSIYDVRYPFCTHAYIINRRCLPTLLSECRDAAMNIDVMLMTRAYPKLRVLTILPRIADQRGMDLLP